MPIDTSVLVSHWPPQIVHGTVTFNPMHSRARASERLVRSDSSHREEGDGSDAGLFDTQTGDDDGGCKGEVCRLQAGGDDVVEANGEVDGGEDDGGEDGRAVLHCAPP